MKIRRVVNRTIDRNAEGLNVKAAISAAIAVNVNESGTTRAEVRHHEGTAAGERPHGTKEAPNDREDEAPHP